MITIESSTGYNISGEIIRKRESDGLVLAVAEKTGFGRTSYSVYLCREYTSNTAGRSSKRATRYEWLSFRDSAPSFDSRDAAISHAMEA